MTSFDPRRDVRAISHLNVVVDDIEVATEFYGTVLGLEQLANADGTMDHPGVDLASFARNAGLDDGQLQLHVRFLKHAGLGQVLLLDRSVGRPVGDGTGPPDRPYGDGNRRLSRDRRKPRGLG